MQGHDLGNCFPLRAGHSGRGVPAKHPQGARPPAVCNANAVPSCRLWYCICLAPRLTFEYPQMQECAV